MSLGPDIAQGKQGFLGEAPLNGELVVLGIREPVMDIDTRRTHDRKQNTPVYGAVGITGANVQRWEGDGEPLQLADAVLAINEGRRERGSIAHVEKSERRSADLIEAGGALERSKKQAVSGADAGVAWAAG